MGSSSAMIRLRWDHRDSKEYVLPQKEEDAKTTRMPYSLDGDDVAGTKQESPRTRGFSGTDGLRKGGTKSNDLSIFTMMPEN